MQFREIWAASHHRSQWPFTISIQNRRTTTIHRSASAAFASKFGFPFCVVVATLNQSSSFQWIFTFLNNSSLQYLCMCCLSRAHFASRFLWCFFCAYQCTLYGYVVCLHVMCIFVYEKRIPLASGERIVQEVLFFSRIKSHKPTMECGTPWKPVFFFISIIY